jgi:hypothetical protein
VGDIVINEHFINTVITALGGIADTIPDAERGQWYTTDMPMNLNELVLHTGAPGFPHGVTLATDVKARGSDLYQELDKHNTTITDFITGLRNLLDQTDHVESLNSMSADQFASYFDHGKDTKKT